MAVNPITSEALTIDYKSLMRIPIGRRALAASTSSEFTQAILSSLSPFQIAQAFPDYYRKSLPDVSNFITSNIERKLKDRGMTWNQTGGGQEGYQTSYYDGPYKTRSTARPRGVPEPTVTDMKKELMKKGIDVDGVYNTVEKGPILEGNEKTKFLKGLSNDELKKMGLQRVQDENGKNLIKELPLEATALSEAEILRRSGGKVMPGTEGLRGRAELAKMTYDAFTEAGLSDSQARAAVAEVNRENSLNPIYMFGTHAEMASHVKGRTNYGIFSWGDPSRAKAFREYMEKNGVMDASGNLLVDNNTYLKNQAKFAVEEMKGYESGKQFLENKEVTYQEGVNLLGRYIGWDMSGRRHDASASYERLQEGRKIIDEVNDKMGKILPDNATPEQIEEARRILVGREKEGRAEVLTRKLYEESSASSSDYQGPTAVVEKQKDVAGIRRKSLDSDVRTALEYAAERNGIMVEVVSGGQMSIEEAKKLGAVKVGKRWQLPNGQFVRTGSTRHDEGGAGDIKLYRLNEKNEKVYLNMMREEDRNIMSSFVSDSVSAGMTGVGAGRGYMGDETLHIGKGKATSWGGADWIEAARTKGTESPIDIQAWKEEKEKRLAETKETEIPIVTEVAADATNMPANRPFSLAKGSKIDVMKQQLQEVPKLALGGNLYGVNEDLTLSNTKTGQPIAQINQNERLIKQGNALQVTSESKLKADELSEMYDMSERMDKIEIASEPQQSQVRQVPIEKVNTNLMEEDRRWQEKVANAQYEQGTQTRAFARVKFLPEGYHFSRNAPNSIT